MGDEFEIKLPLNQRLRVHCKAVWGDKAVLSGRVARTNHPGRRSIRQLHLASEVGAYGVQELTAGAVLIETFQSRNRTGISVCSSSTSRFELAPSANHTPSKINKQTSAAPHQPRLGRATANEGFGGTREGGLIGSAPR